MASRSRISTLTVIRRLPKGRCPLLDRQVEDCIVGLPLECRARGSWVDYLRERALNKYELKHVLAAKLLPRSIVHKTKGGFTPPLRSWLEKALAGKSARDWLPSAFIQTEILDPNMIDRMTVEHCSGQRNWSVPIFLTPIPGKMAPAVRCGSSARGANMDAEGSGYRRLRILT